MTTVTPKVGYYLVRQVDAKGVRTHLVGKDKHCTCGGHARRKCSHIRAVADHPRSGGERAPSGDAAECVHDSKPGKEERSIPETCPFCNGKVEALGADFWRCSTDPTHYWRWRAEQNGGAIKRFLTQPHAAKKGAFYEMSDGERCAFLVRVRQRMHADGYTPHCTGGNGNDQ